MKLINTSFRALFASFVAGLLSFPLAGCGSDSRVSTTPPPPGSYEGVTFTGKALAGTQPIVGAEVSLYAAGTAGNGSASTQLLSSSLTTSSTGSFTVPAGYLCPASSSQLYLVITGGQVGTSTTNSAIALASAIGICNQITANANFVVNEATTAASVWALSQFLSTGISLGATSTNAQGLGNAVLTVANLVNITSGTSPGAAFPTTGASPAAKVNTLANLLNTCVSSNGDTGSSTPCGQLFANTTPTGGTAPTNTLDAALNLVRHPGDNVASLYTQSTASTAFSPALAKAPSDWILFINYTGGGMHSTSGTGVDGLGIDSIGNIWVANYFGTASKFSPTGQPIFASGISGSGLNESYGLAVDASNNVWITNEPTGSLGNSVTVLNSSGQAVSGTNGYTAGGLNFPIAIAIDPNATAWVVDYGDSYVSLLSSTGQSLAGTIGYTTSSFAFPVAIAIDANHNGWVVNQSGDSVTKVAPDGSKFTTISCCDYPAGIAIDQQGNIWVTNYYGDSVSEISSAGTVVSTGYTGGGILHPQGIAIDGSGNVWVGNVRGTSISQLAGAASTSPGQVLSPAAGWAPDAALLEAYSVAIDASGNLWVTNFGNDSLTELVGLAAPVKTPLLGPPQTP